jgi:hypothetical protein
MWNEAVNTLVAAHLAWTDFEIEAKLKNLASEGLAKQIREYVAQGSELWATRRSIISDHRSPDLE